MNSLTIKPKFNIISKIIHFIFFGLVGLVVSITLAKNIKEFIFWFWYSDTSINKLDIFDVSISLATFCVLTILLVLIIKALFNSLRYRVIYYDSFALYINEKEIKFSEIDSFKIYDYQCSSIDIKLKNPKKAQKYTGVIGYYCSRKHIEKIRDIFLSKNISDESFRPILKLKEALKKKFT